MHMLNSAVDQLTLPRTTNHNDNDTRPERQPRDREDDGLFKSLVTRLTGCLRRRIDLFCFTCFCGLIILLGGVACLIMYICSASRFGSLLMPGLAMFVIGVTMAAVGEWYCRSRLNRRDELYDQATREEIIERISDAAARRCVSHFQDMPPSYYALYRTHRTLPVTDVYVVNNSRSFHASDSTMNSQSNSSTNADVLPSYSEVV